MATSQSWLRNAESISRRKVSVLTITLICKLTIGLIATDVEGIFRLSGSAKRIKDLQAIFNSPERYGKGLDWTGYTVHDAANILRRYLNQLPEPIVPLEFYERFRDPLRGHQSQVPTDGDGPLELDLTDFNHDSAVTTYQKLITELPALNRQLLLYILDLLAVFSSKSDLNRMTSANLAAIFQPGIISHPSHDMAPQEYRLSQDVVIFLIENQDNFLIGMTGTAIDEKTNKEVQSGIVPTASSPKLGSNIGRSASNASAGADSLRRFAGSVRRNVSVSSRNSRGSRGAGSPGNVSPGAAYSGSTATSGIHRSNTVPSKRSSGIPSPRYSPRAPEYSPPVSATLAQPTTKPSPLSPSASQLSSALRAEQLGAIDGRYTSNTLQVPAGLASPPANHTPTSERKLSSLFKKPAQSGSISDNEKKESRQPKRLQKKQKMPGSANESAQSSQASLHGETPVTPGYHTPLMSPDASNGNRADPMSLANPAIGEAPNAAAAKDAPTTTARTLPNSQSPPNQANHVQGGSLLPPPSPKPSAHSGASGTDPSDMEAIDLDPSSKAERKRHRWRFSSTAKKESPGDSPLQPPPRIGENVRAGRSNSSIASSNRPRKSFTGDSQQTQPTGTDTFSSGHSSAIPQSSQESESITALKEGSVEPEKKSGLFGKLKAKIGHNKDEKKELSMPQTPTTGTTFESEPRQSLSASIRDHLPNRGRSIDRPRDELGH